MLRIEHGTGQFAIANEGSAQTYSSDGRSSGWAEPFPRKMRFGRAAGEDEDLVAKLARDAAGFQVVAQGGVRGIPGT